MKSNNVATCNHETDKSLYIILWLIKRFINKMNADKTY